MEVYHYTSEDGLRRIRQSGYIRESPLSNKDAHYGAGVYLTTLTPAEGRKAIADNNWGRFGQSMEDKGRVDRAIQLQIPRGNLIKAESRERDIWIHRGDLILRHYRHFFLNLDQVQDNSWCTVL